VSDGGNAVVSRAAADARRARDGLAGLTPILGVGVVLAVLYGPALRDLLTLWSHVPYYAYGVLVPIWSAWLAAGATARVAALPHRREPAALVVVAAGLATLALAVSLRDLTLAMLSLPLVLGGLGRFALGREAFRPLVFPVAFLALMAPLPPGLLPVLSHHLQQLAAWFTGGVLTALGIPFLREGVYVHLRPVTVHISEACNGLRFLLAMVVLGIAFGWTTRRGTGVRVLLAGVAIVTAVAANLVRVAGTTVLVDAWGPAASTGLFHNLFGKAIYLVALGAFVLVVVRLRK
jgi:exosortase